MHKSPSHSTRLALDVVSAPLRHSLKISLHALQSAAVSHSLLFLNESLESKF